MHLLEAALTGKRILEEGGAMFGRAGVGPGCEDCVPGAGA